MLGGRWTVRGTAHDRPGRKAGELLGAATTQRPAVSDLEQHHRGVADRSHLGEGPFLCSGCVCACARMCRDSSIATG